MGGFDGVGHILQGYQGNSQAQIYAQKLLTFVLRSFFWFHN